MRPTVLRRAFALAGAALIISTTAVYADQLQNELDSGNPDMTLDSISLPVSGGQVVVDVWLTGDNGDGDNGCNLEGGDSATFTVTSSDPSVATFSPSSFALTACTSSNSFAINVTPLTQGTANAQFAFNSGASSVDGGETFVASSGNFTAVVDEAPAIASTDPADGASDVAAGSNIAVNFSEAVNITNTDGWYDILCTDSGPHTAATTGGGSTAITLNPDADFTAAETCTVNIVKNHVSDADTFDGLNNPTDNYEFSFTIAGADNVPPLVDAGGPYSGDEGSAIPLDGGSASDADSDPLTYAWTIDDTGIDAGGDCTVADATSLTLATVTCDDDSNGGTFDVTLTVSGDPDGPVFDATTITVSNVAPTATLDGANSASVIENVAYVTYNYVAEDAGDNDIVSATIDCGAAGSLVSGSDSGSSFQCQFLDGGGPVTPATTSDVTVSVVDDEGASSATDTQTVAIANADPIVAAPAFVSTTVCQGSQATLSGISFSDDGTIDNPWGVSIDWDDGSTDYSTSVSTQGAQSNVSPTYNTPGTYQATVTVTDKDGGQGFNTSSNSVTVVAHYSIYFLQPVDGTTTGTTTNSVKLGRVVPIKILIWDNCANDFDGGWVTDPATLVRLRAALAPASGGTLLDSVETYADAGQANSNTLYFRWTADASAPGGGFWIYNLDTKNSLQPKFELSNTYRVDASIGGVLAAGSDSQYALLKMAK